MDVLKKEGDNNNVHFYLPIFLLVKTIFDLLPVICLGPNNNLSFQPYFCTFHCWVDVRIPH